MCSVGHERPKVRDHLQKDVAYALDDSILLLSLNQRITKARAHRDDVVDIPEHLLQEVRPPGRRDDILIDQAFDPDLQRMSVS